MVDSQYYLPNNIRISKLDCKEAYELLSPKEKLYAHYLSRAAWYGGLVVLVQTSPESPAIYALLQKLFRKQTPAELEKVATEAGLSSEEYQVSSMQVIRQAHNPPVCFPPTTTMNHAHATWCQNVGT